MSKSETFDAVVASLKTRARAEASIAAARDRWEAENDMLVDLVSPYTIGMTAEYVKGGKRHRICVASIQVARQMKPSTKIGDVPDLADMSLVFRGPAILADGKTGKGEGQFLLKFTDILSRK